MFDALSSHEPVPPSLEHASVLRVHPQTEHGDGAAVAIVGGVDDELIVQCDPRSQHRKTVVSLEDPFGTGIGQLSVANQNSEASGIEERLVHFGDAVDDSGNTERVVGAPSFLSEI